MASWISAFYQASIGGKYKAVEVELVREDGSVERRRIRAVLVEKPGHGMIIVPSAGGDGLLRDYLAVLGCAADRDGGAGYSVLSMVPTSASGVNLACVTTLIANQPVGRRKQK